MAGTGQRKAVILGDLVATSHHLPLPYIPAFDQYPMESMERKRKLLEDAEKHGWLLVFAHDPETISGYVGKPRRPRPAQPRQGLLAVLLR